MKDRPFEVLINVILLGYGQALYLILIYYIKIR